MKNMNDQNVTMMNLRRRIRNTEKREMSIVRVLINKQHKKKFFKRKDEPGELENRTITRTFIPPSITMTWHPTKPQKQQKKNKKTTKKKPPNHSSCSQPHSSPPVHNLAASKPRRRLLLVGAEPLETSLENRNRTEKLALSKIAPQNNLHRGHSQRRARPRSAATPWPRPRGCRAAAPRPQRPPRSSPCSLGERRRRREQPSRRRAPFRAWAPTTRTTRAPSRDGTTP